MSQQLHRTAIKEYIKKKSGWTNRVFSQVNGDAYDMAFKQLTRGNQIMVAKLIYNIVNTNKQNHQFCGKSSLCPCCKSSDESLPHLLSCASPCSAQNRNKALLELQTNLKAISTLLEVVNALTHCMFLWIAAQQGEQTSVNALIAGSLRGPDITDNGFHRTVSFCWQNPSRHNHKGYLPICQIPSKPKHNPPQAQISLFQLYFRAMLKIRYRQH